MGKKIIVTAGPTNERIDSVMKITNMSTGSLGCFVAEELQRRMADEIDRIYYISPKLARKPANITSKVEYITIESAEDLLAEITRLFIMGHIDAVVHSAAVGDYKAKYSVRGEDLAKEIAGRVIEVYEGAGHVLDHDMIGGVILDVLDNPRCAADDSGKMSSYEPHLMTMMALTPKVIGSIKKLSPDTMLIGFKLLDGVTKEELYDVASRLREKNRADYIIANDLSKIGDGMHWAMVVGKDGILKECSTKPEIAEAIVSLIEQHG